MLPLLYKNNFPDNPIQVAHSEAYLGKIYKDLGQYSEAKNLLQKSYTISVEHYGHEHPRTARIVRDLGQVYYLEGDFVKGEQFTQKALEIFQKCEHLERYTIFENLADFHIKQSTQASDKGDPQQAKVCKVKVQSYLLQALEIVQSYFPEDSPHIIRIKDKIKKLNQ